MSTHSSALLRPRYPHRARHRSPRHPRSSRVPTSQSSLRRLQRKADLDYPTSRGCRHRSAMHYHKASSRNAESTNADRRYNEQIHHRTDQIIHHAPSHAASYDKPNRYARRARALHRLPRYGGAHVENLKSSKVGILVRHRTRHIDRRACRRSHWLPQSKMYYPTHQCWQPWSKP